MIELKKQSTAVSVETDKNDINLKKPTTKGEDGKDGKDGEDGGYYKPFINEYCDLYFTPTKPDMPSVPMKNIRGNRGEKGEAGKDGVDGFSPNVYIGDLENGKTIHIVTKEGTKSFNIYNGKDGADGKAKLTINSKYYANDWVNGVIWSAMYSNTGEANFFAIEPLPENAYIVDMSVRWEGVDYRLNEMHYNGLLHPDTVIGIHKKQLLESTFGFYHMGRVYNDYDGIFTTDVQMMGTSAEGFTVYYIECEEGDINENT